MSEKLRHVVDELRAERYVVYGLATDYCVRTAVFGLLKCEAPVELVTDAIKSITPKGDSILQQFTAKGGRLTTTQKVLASL